MKKPSFANIGISVLILLNLIVAVVLLCGHWGKSQPRHRGAMPGKHGIHHGHSKNNGHEGFCHPGSPDPRQLGPAKGHAFHQLDLSKEQQIQFDDLNKQYREKADSIHSKLKDLHQAGKGEQLKTDYDQSQIQKVAAEIGHLHQELYLLQMNKEQQIYSKLNPEQQKKYIELSADKGFHGCRGKSKDR